MQGCTCLFRVSFSHCGICRRINSILFTFITKTNVSKLRKVMELQVHAAWQGGQRHSPELIVFAPRGHWAWAGHRRLEFIRLCNRKLETTEISGPASEKAERTQGAKFGVRIPLGLSHACQGEKGWVPCPSKIVLSCEDCQLFTHSENFVALLLI